MAFIEHSPYCFGKMIDFCRMLRLNSLGLGPIPDLPSVRNADTSRFVKMVKYFNPGDTAELILGVLPADVTSEMLEEILGDVMDPGDDW